MKILFMSTIIVVNTLFVFLGCWVLAKSLVAADCEKNGVFSIGNTVYECKVKGDKNV